MTADGAPHDPSGGAVQGTAPPEDPWARYGWLLGAIWLVFLAFPLGATFFVDRSLPVRAAGVVLILVFAGVYLHAMWLDDQTERHAACRFPWLHLAAIALIALATTPVIGLAALGLIPFVLSLAGISLPPRQALLLLAAALLLLVVSATVFGDLAEWWFFFLIYPMVTLTLVLIRTLDGSSSRQREAQRLLEIAGERERVARDVHDVLGHSLTVVTVKAELAERLVDVDPERAKAEIAEVRSISREALAEIRATVAGLRVARLTDEIEAAGRALSGAGIALDVAGDPADVDPRHRITLAWALREATTNVVRHSGAGRCEVTLEADRLTVRDDGKGARGHKEGNGIRGLRERVHQTGGAVHIEAADPGTRVVVQL